MLSTSASEIVLGKLALAVEFVAVVELHMT
jgi:hypothetical protein